MRIERKWKLWLTTLAVTMGTAYLGLAHQPKPAVEEEIRGRLNAISLEKPDQPEAMAFFATTVNALGRTEVENVQGDPNELKRLAGQEVVIHKVGDTVQKIERGLLAASVQNPTAVPQVKIAEINCNFANAATLVPPNGELIQTANDYYRDQLGAGNVFPGGILKSVQLGAMERYKDGNGNMLFGNVAIDCLTQAQMDQNISAYKQFVLHLPENMAGTGYGGTIYMAIHGVPKEVGVVWAPKLWFVDQVLASGHEIGHTLGLGHLADINGTTYRNRFSPLGDPYDGCNATPENGAYCISANLSGAERRRLGLSGGTVMSGSRYLIRYLGRGNYIDVVNPDGTSTVLEWRSQGEGYDNHIPGSGLLVQTVDPKRVDAIHLFNYRSDPYDQRVLLQPGEKLQIGNLRVCVLSPRMVATSVGELECVRKILLPVVSKGR